MTITSATSRHYLGHTRRNLFRAVALLSAAAAAIVVTAVFLLSSSSTHHAQPLAPAPHVAKAGVNVHQLHAINCAPTRIVHPC